MPPELAAPMFDRLVAAVAAQQVTVATGRFGADMRVDLANDGPLTLIVNSRGAK
jgi:D-tyrosyl-tRNA(Tyr) deacylase